MSPTQAGSQSILLGNLWLKKARDIDLLDMPYSVASPRVGVGSKQQNDYSQDSSPDFM